MRFDGWVWRHVVHCMAAMSVLEQALLSAGYIGDSG